MTNVVIIAVIAVILGVAVRYIVKAKKSGAKCIGCPSGGTCSGCCGEDTCSCGK